MLKNVLHVAGSGSAFNTLANAILILKVNGIHTVCKPLEPDVYDVPHCRYINLQWGKYDINVTKDYTYANINLPLTCNLNEPLFIVPSIMCNNANNTKDFNIQCSGYNTTSISFIVRCLSSTRDDFTFQWFLVSK